MFKLGLNPYGLTYTLGLQGQGTRRANPQGGGLTDFLEIGTDLGVRTLEIHEPWLAELDDERLEALRARLAVERITPIVSAGLQRADIQRCIRSALGLGATLIRFALTPVLSGDRAAAGPKWPELVAGVRARLPAHAATAAKHGIRIGIENHQDFTSAELVSLCRESGDNVGIVYDTGNSFPVAEAPLDFTERVAPHVCHVHLKDYRVQWTDQGLLLVRCAIGDGAVPFRELVAMLGDHHRTLTAVLEPGALEARHVRLFTPDWWSGYAPRSAAELAACLHAARRNRLADDADGRTPWEREADGDLIQYELDMIRRSAANMKALGIMGAEKRA